MVVMFVVVIVVVVVVVIGSLLLYLVSCCWLMLCLLLEIIQCVICQYFIDVVRIFARTNDICYYSAFIVASYKRKTNQVLFTIVADHMLKVLRIRTGCYFYGVEIVIILLLCMFVQVLNKLLYSCLYCTIVFSVLMLL